MPNWKKVIVSGSNAVLNHITASGHMSVLDGGLTVNTHVSTELEVVGDISASSGTITGNNITAANQLETKYRKLNITAVSNPGDYSGDVVFFGSQGTGFQEDRIHYYDGANWNIATYSQSPPSTALLAIALGGTPSAGMLIRGFITIGGIFGSAGDALYLGNTGGYASSPPGNNGWISRVVAHHVSNNGTNTQMYFNPSPDWIEIEA